MSYEWLLELVQARLEGQQLNAEDLAYVHQQWERFETDAVQALADDIALTLERF